MKYYSNKVISIIYYSLLFIFLTPSFNLGFLYSHKLGKIGILLLFAFVIALLFLKKRSVTLPKFQTWAILLFFISQSISIISALDLNRFFIQYRDIILSLMVYFIGIFITTYPKKKSRNAMVFVILLAVAVNVIIKSVLYFFPELLDSFFSSLLNPDFVATIAVNLVRGRIYFETYDEVFVPLLFYVFFYSSWRGKTVSGILIAAVTITSYLSTFRTKFLMLIVALLGSVLLNAKKHRKTVFISGVILVFVIGAAATILTRLQGYSLIDRFLLADEAEDVVTLTRREDLFYDGITIGKTSLFIGAGLNQFDYYVAGVKNRPTQGTFRIFNKDLVADDRRPHDILSFTFAETGVLGLVALFILYASFILNDQKILNGKDEYLKSLVVAFWSLVVFALLNPATNFSYLFLFWFLRSQLTPVIKEE